MICNSTAILVFPFWSSLFLLCTTSCIAQTESWMNIKSFKCYKRVMFKYFLIKRRSEYINALQMIANTYDTPRPFEKFSIAWCHINHSDIDVSEILVFIKVYSDSKRNWWCYGLKLFIKIQYIVFSITAIKYWRHRTKLHMFRTGNKTYYTLTSRLAPRKFCQLRKQSSFHTTSCYHFERPFLQLLLMYHL